MKLFWRIFLSFWLATILMIAAVVAVGELWPFIFSRERNKFEPEAAQAILAEAVDAYEREGSSGLSTALQKLAVSLHKPLFLFNQDGKSYLALELLPDTSAISRAKFSTPGVLNFNPTLVCVSYL
jgi:hypothetical protein